MAVHDRSYPDTLDGKYFLVRGRLWRRSNPTLSEDDRRTLVSKLMSARRAVRAAKGKPDRTALARSRVDKTALGERGPVWWTDGTPDYNRKLAKNTPYADWAKTLDG
jgi:hypothetical protein